jgi:hypothetical protein
MLRQGASSRPKVIRQSMGFGSFIFLENSNQPLIPNTETKNHSTCVVFFCFVKALFFHNARNSLSLDGANWSRTSALLFRIKTEAAVYILLWQVASFLVPQECFNFPA